MFLNKKNVLFFYVTPNDEIRYLIKHLFAEFVARDSFSTDMFRNYMQIFYTAIIRNQETKRSLILNEQGIAGNSCMPAILQYIEKNYLTVTLEMLAKEFHYSTSYMSKLIHQNTNKTYVEILTEIRLRTAQKLLQETNLSIQQIADRSGYHSADNFNHAFRKSIGISPREYRKKIKNML